METLIAVASALVAVAVSWGIFSNKLETQKEEIRAIREEMKGFVRSETCVQSHKYTDRDMLELKQSIREIKEMISRLIEKSE